MCTPEFTAAEAADVFAICMFVLPPLVSAEDWVNAVQLRYNISAPITLYHKAKNLGFEGQVDAFDSWIDQLLKDEEVRSALTLFCAGFEARALVPFLNRWMCFLNSRNVAPAVM
jgi:hypothetical protein